MAKKKYSSKRPGYQACGKMVWGDAQKALKLAQRLKKLVNVEYKTRETAQTALNVIDGIGSHIFLCGIQRGLTTNDRDGSQVKATSIQLKYTISQHASATLTSFRVLLVIDKQTNQAVFTTADLLQNVTNIQSVVSFRNLDNMHRFNVIYDKVHVLSSNGSHMQQGYFAKSLQLLLRYDADAGTIADLTQNSITMVVISNEPTNTPTMSAAIRIKFVDN